MKSLQESLFDNDLVSKQSDEEVCVEVRDNLKKISELNPEIEFDVVKNRNNTTSNMIRIIHTVHPLDTTKWPECQFSMDFEVVFLKDLTTYVYLSELFFAVKGSYSEQRKYNNYVSLDKLSKLPYIKFTGYKDPATVSMKDPKEMGCIYDDLKQIISNFYNEETLSLMQQYADTYIETDKRPRLIMSKIVNLISKIYSKSHY